MRARIWLTGFQPFGIHAVNPSQQLVERILHSTQMYHIESVPPYFLESESVEITFDGTILTVDEDGSKHSLDFLSNVDAVIHVGLNEKAEKIRFEMCAINESDFRILDNSGRQLTDVLVDDSGLPLLHTTAHRPSLVSAFSADDSIEISEDCGRFVCNETYYRTLNAIEQRGILTEERPLPAIFVHIPPFEHVPEDKQLEILGELAARMVQKPIIQVVGGVVVNSDGQILACRRAPNQVMAGDWEFPGGKVDAGESNEQALKRELHEELGIEVDVGELIGSVEHQYSSMIVKLSFYSCKTEASDFSMRVHDEIRWVDEDEANQLNWLPADVEFVAKLVDEGFSTL